MEFGLGGFRLGLGLGLRFELGFELGSACATAALQSPPCGCAKW